MFLIVQKKDMSTFELYGIVAI